MATHTLSTCGLTGHSLSILKSKKCYSKESSNPVLPLGLHQLGPIDGLHRLGPIDPLILKIVLILQYSLLLCWYVWWVTDDKASCCPLLELAHGHLKKNWDTSDQMHHNYSRGPHGDPWLGSPLACLLSSFGGWGVDFCMVASSDSSHLVRSGVVKQLLESLGLLFTEFYGIYPIVWANSSANSMSIASLRAAAKSAGLLRSNNWQFWGESCQKMLEQYC